MGRRRWARLQPSGCRGVAYSRLNRTPGDLKESFTIGWQEIPDDEYYHRTEARRHFAENRWPEGFPR